MVAYFQWLNENVAFPLIDRYLVEKWLEAVALSHGRTVRQLSYIFCDDAKILDVNRQFLNHDYYTDIITFDYCIGTLLRGDMYISLDTVRSNAELVGSDFDTELHRVIVHGLLHLCGINDKGPGEREIMEKAEDDALELLKQFRFSNPNTR